MRTYPDIGVAVGGLMLPRPQIDLSRWAVVACDQFTSQPEYWQQVAALVGDAPSTYHLVLPEVYLGTAAEEQKLSAIHAAMQRYCADDIFQTIDTLVLVERSVAGHIRHGLMLSLDLEQYEYHAGSQSLIRATEDTILDRLPPRIKIRQGAPLETPHILVLIDDPEQTVIEPLVAHKRDFTPVYDVDLMLGSGHLSGYAITDAVVEQRAMAALARLAQPQPFAEKYGEHKGVLLFAMGDGNHSFATAKAIWEGMKDRVGPDHPARYALVEVENVHDAGLIFEPIHRVIFDVTSNAQAAMRAAWGERLTLAGCASIEEMIHLVNHPDGDEQRFGMISTTGCAMVSLSHPTSHLTVGSLQSFLDTWGKAGGFAKIDYVHGAQALEELSRMPGNLGFYLPVLAKADLFNTVILEGALPRKTFSMGEAIEKRFYLECRKIVP